MPKSKDQGGATPKSTGAGINRGFIEEVIGTFTGGGWGGFGYQDQNDPTVLGVKAALQQRGIETEERPTPGGGWSLYKAGAPGNPPPTPETPPGDTGGGGSGGGTGGGIGGGAALAGLQAFMPPTSGGSQQSGFRTGIGQRQPPPLASALAGLKRIY